MTVSLLKKGQSIIPDVSLPDEPQTLHWEITNGMDELTKDLKDPGTLMNMDNDEKELWVEYIRAELKSFEDLE
eukprot:12930685-Prorocentrum_lima.AAC.1